MGCGMKVYVQHSDSVNFRYGTGLEAEGAFHVFSDSVNVVLVPNMEKERAKCEVKENIDVLSYSDLNCKTSSECLVNLLKKLECLEVAVPEDFPVKLAMEIQKNFELKVERSPVVCKRMIKTEKEVELIRESCVAAVKAFKFMVKLVEKSRNGEKRGKGKKERERWRECEELRRLVELYLFSKGFLAEGTIIASGVKTYQPHWRGYGIIENHVIADIFPRGIESHYYGDFTRTVLIEENLEIKEMLEAVIQAKNDAEKIVKEGVKACDIHGKVCETLESFGYKTDERGGFIHSTGHGVGLEVHEEPRIGNNEDVIKSGMVFTIEPGLYYKGVGGVRVEDTVVVRRSGCEVLTKCEDFVKV